MIYQWQFAINNIVYFGRDLKEYVEFIKILSDKLYLSPIRRLIVYVHNLSYEFQWIRHWFEWEEVFAVEKRKVLNCLDKNGIMYKCSYLLTHKSLKEVAKDIGMQKLVGEIDYNEILAPWTELDEKHIRYGIYDVEIIVEKIKEELKSFDTLTDIPSTMTGYVRRECRDRCLHSGNWKHDRQYRDFMKSFTIERQEYEMLRNRIFQGGKVTSSHQNVRKTMYNVASYDITSSYPAVLFCEYPMKKGEYIGDITLEKYYELKSKYCLMFRISMKNLAEKNGNVGYISESKCTHLKNNVTANGMIYSAEEIITYGTDIDYEIINTVYNYTDIKLDMCWIYKKGYLPPCILKYVLELFQSKTKLKGDKEKENDYMRAKNNFNSIYGMMVTSMIREVIDYDEDWNSHLTEEEKENQLEIENNKMNKFLLYPWGVWVTAYARQALYTLIMQIGDDFIYCDTDSIKLLNYEKHKDKFILYNQQIENRNKKHVERLGLKDNLFIATNNTGEKFSLGTWTFEGISEKFKTLGAKRYLEYKYDEKEKRKILKLTVAGLSKSKACRYLNRKAYPFELFDDGLVVPKEMSGRIVFKYIDDAYSIDVEDKNGQWGKVHEKSAIVLEDSEYHLGIGNDFKSFLEGIITEVI